MRGLVKRGAGWWMAGVCCGLFWAMLLYAQQADLPGIRTTTAERLESEPWWPTMSRAPLNAYTGTAGCVKCHTDEAGRGQPTSMERAAELLTNDGFMRGHKPAVYTSAPFTYGLRGAGAGLEYAVTDGSHSATQRIEWVMGAGDLGRTFLYVNDGRWFQSEASFYTAGGGVLDLTTGLSTMRGVHEGGELASALGEELSASDTRLCFGCHTVHATTSAGFNPVHAEVGLGCEACHGPGRVHAEHMAQAGKSPSRAAHAEDVFNPAKLAPADSIDFCGSCHRASADVKIPAGQSGSTAMVRFQPYRLEKSRCWRATQDARLTCVACHDPHEPVVRAAASYDKRCLTCHSGSHAAAAEEHAGKVCPKAQSQCTTCHMQKVAIASMHGEFTDHWIRVARAGEPFQP